MSTAAGSSDDDDFEQISFGQPQPPMPPPKPRQPKAKSQSAIAKAAKSSATQSSTQGGTQGGGTQGGGTQGGGTQGRTKMPPSTTAAIVSLAQAGKSLVGIRRGLIEGDHRNSVGKLFPATGKDFNVILRTLKANGIKEPDEDHESDFADAEQMECDEEEDGDDEEEAAEEEEADGGDQDEGEEGDEEGDDDDDDDDEMEQKGEEGEEDADADVPLPQGVKPRHAKRTGGPPGGTAKPAKPSGAKPAASAVDGTSLGRESLGLRGSAAAVVYNDAARFSQLMKQDGAVSQSQARPAASGGGAIAKRSTSASQGGAKKPAYRAPLLPASSQPSAQPSATAQRATASQAEPRKPKRARLAEEAAQSGERRRLCHHPCPPNPDHDLPGRQHC